MTRKTILRRRLQIQNRARIEMTFCTSHISMFSIQLKNKSGVFEIIPVSVHTIMTGEAIRPEGQDMRLGEDNVHLTVAGLAGVESESCYIPMMAIIAGKCFMRDFELMPV